MLVSRKWSEAKITVVVTDQRLGISMDLDNFLKVLAKEVSHPTKLVTRGQLDRALAKAAEIIIHQMKAATERVV